MAHVVTEKCIKCKYTDCVEVCPVDCFLELPDMLIIDPNTCIDCGLCVQECPVNAIVNDLYDPTNTWSLYNKNKIKDAVPIFEKKLPPKDADSFAHKENKEALLPDFKEKSQ